MIQPIYGRFDIRTDFFFVPNRLIWDNWQKFISPDFDQITNPDITFPCFKPSNTDLLTEVNITHLKEGTLADYLGCGIPDVATANRTSTVRISALPFRAYHLIYNEFYRDQDLQDEFPLRKGDGFIYADDQQLFNFSVSNWEKDYFTTARPWAQKGGPVKVPIDAGDIVRTATGEPVSSAAVTIYDGNMVTEDTLDPLTFNDGFSIEDLRYANSLQQYLEKLSRKGSRYIETIKSFLVSQRLILGFKDLSSSEEDVNLLLFQKFCKLIVL